MAVWAFACKLDSSLNRWFDGTDQDISFNDGIVAEIEKGVPDIMATLDEQRKVWEKQISQVKSGIGTMMFNEVMFNTYFSNLSDFDDAIFMQDDVDINLSRSIIRISDILYPVEYFNKELGSTRSDDVSPIDDSFINLNDDGFALDDATVSDVATVGMTRTIQPDVSDSISFTDDVHVGIGGKSIYDIVNPKDSVTKELTNVVGDETYSGSIGTLLFNELMFNGVGEEATITTVIGLTEEVQIILT